MKTKKFGLLSLCRILATGILASASLASAQKASDDILSFVPADTPFAVAVVEPFPEEFIRRYEAMLEPLFEIYREALDQVVADAKGSEDQRAELRRHFDKLNPDGLASIGLDLRGRFVIYGVGFSPVFRWELKDPELLRDALSQSEVFRKTLRTTERGDEYWYLGAEAKSEGTASMAIQGRHLVLGFHPRTSAGEPRIDELIFSKPDVSLADSRRLGAIAARHRFLPYIVGFADSIRIGELAFDLSEGADETCRSETLSMVESVPMVAFGLTDLTDEQIGSEMVIELAPELTSELATLVNSVPGVGAETDGMMSFGLSLNLPGLVDFVSRRADAVKDDPFECACYTDLNTQLASASQSMKSQIAAGPFAGLQGVNAVLKNVELQQGSPVSFDGHLTLYAEDPSALIQIAGLSIPQLSELDLEVGGEPKPLPAGILPPPMNESVIALTERALGVATGAGASADLMAAFRAPTLNPTPFVSVFYQIAAYRLLLQESMEEALKNQGGEASNEQELVSRLLSIYDYIESSQMHLTLTDAGLSYAQLIKLSR